MNSTAKVTTAAIVIILAFFLLPVLPLDSSNSVAFGFAHVTFRADVSPSFSLFNCGMVWNPTATSFVLGFKTGQSIAPSGFYCHMAPSS
jgi:hypothetical protein